MGFRIAEEARKWVEAGIISEEQYIKIIALYPKKSGFGYLIPFLASLLVGLGLVSWVAANWDHMDSWIRLVICAVFTLGFYGLADWFRRNGNEPSQIGMLGLGTISFGVSMIVIVQTFHLGGSAMFPFVFWSLAALAIAWWKRSTVLYLLGWAVSFAGITNEFGNGFWLYALLLIYVAGYLGFIRMKGTHWLLWVWVAGSLPYVFRVIMETGLDSYWITLWWLLLFVVSQWMKTPAEQYPFRIVGLYAMIVSGLLMIVSGDTFRFWTDWQTEKTIFLSLVILLLVVIGWKFVRSGQRLVWIDALILVPAFLWNVAPSLVDEPFGAGNEWLKLWLLLPLLPYAVHALLTMWRGGLQDLRFLSILGIIQFLACALTLFVAVDWDFNVKFLIFVISGIVLFVSYSLVRRQAHRLKGDDL